MKPRLASPPSFDSPPAPAGFPDADELAALRAWYAGMTVRQAVERYLPDRLGEGRSARGVIGAIRRRLVRVARQVGRPDLAERLGHADSERLQQAKAAAEAIGLLRHARAPVPQISDDVGLWLPARAVGALRAHGIATLADLTVRIPRRRQWWRAIAGLGVASARRKMPRCAAHPALTER
ncbi:phage integrase family protein, partial [Burkholderia sp. BCCCDS15]|uniref:phage integrase family protein n=1 Tax=Burkholderia sp. BCCCDS15 TaxID=3390242 RepID=UPI003D2EAE41